MQREMELAEEKAVEAAGVAEVAANTARDAEWSARHNGILQDGESLPVRLPFSVARHSHSPSVPRHRHNQLFHPVDWQEAAQQTYDAAAALSETLRLQARISAHQAREAWKQADEELKELEMAVAKRRAELDKEREERRQQNMGAEAYGVTGGIVRS